MSELVGRNGAWTFDGHVVRIVPIPDEGLDVARLRDALGEIAVPLEAVAGVAFEAACEGGEKAEKPEKAEKAEKAEDRAGRIRLRLRAGADPLLEACGGRLDDEADPYVLEVPVGRGGVAEYFAEEVHDALRAARVPAEPTDRYLVAPPPVPVLAKGQDGIGSFDGETVRLEWGWLADGTKRRVGDRAWPLAVLEAVEWWPAVGTDWGWIRFRVRGEAGIVSANPRLDPNCLALWGLKRESGNSAVLAAAIVGRMPHPNAGPEAALEAAPDAVPGTASGAAADGAADGAADAAADAAETVGPPAASDHDALLRRLRELGDLHRDGVLTDEEFALAKRAVLKQM